MIAHNQSHKPFAGIHRMSVDIYRDRPVIVFQIRIIGVRTQIHPFGKVGVTQKTVMLFVGIAVNDATFNLAANLAYGSDAGIFINFCRDFYRRFFPDIQRRPCR